MMKRMACALALAAGTGLTLGVATHTALAQPTPATAASGLKLSVVPLGAVTADTPVALDVNFRGGKVRNVEVFLDGARIAKEAIDTVDTHGVLSFKLPASLLAEGSHEITIQAVDKDGSTASTTTRIHVNAPAQESIAHFVSPKRNAIAIDQTPIEVKIDEDLKDAYVMFFLDGQFLSFRNYAPYVYSLDASKYSDGDHIIKIEVFDSAGTSLIKTLTMPLKIHNPDKLTTIEKTTTSVDPKVPPTTPVFPARPDALFGLPNTTFNAPSFSGLAHSGADARVSVGMRNGSEPNIRYTGVKSTYVPGVPSSGTLNPERNPLDPENDLARPTLGNPTVTRPNSATPSTKLNPGSPIANNDNHARVVPQPTINSSLPGVLADPSDLNALNGETSRVARQNVSFRRTGNVAARPSTTLDSPAVPAAAHATHAVPVHPIQVAQAPQTHVGTRSMHNKHVKTFDVAFDNTQIAFDVPPRVENGLPLAPFRAIFEHSGGTVKWYGESKTVHAVSNSKEIEIHIGEKEALVNNQKVKMDAKAYIDRGRTIVPLSFVKDSMDVKVTYDAASGHVLIESNK